jgi:transcriptional regulator with XRE-family HTH domain
MGDNRFISHGFDGKPAFEVKWISWNQAIADIRKGFKVSQKEIADELGYSPQQISRFESCGVEPPIDFWIKFSTRFDVNLIWLLTGMGQSADGLSGPQFNPDSFEIISTKDLQKELQYREEMLGFYKKAYEDAKKKASFTGNSFNRFKDEVSKEVEKVVPADAPKWLKDDFQEKVLGFIGKIKP